MQQIDLSGTKFDKDRFNKLRADIEDIVGKHEPAQFMLAVCGWETLGVITSDSPKKQQWGDAWEGIKIEPGLGQKWTSTKPIVIGSLEAFVDSDRADEFMGCYSSRHFDFDSFRELVLMNSDIFRIVKMLQPASQFL